MPLSARFKTNRNGEQLTGERTTRHITELHACTKAKREHDDDTQ